MRSFHARSYATSYATSRATSRTAPLRNLSADSYAAETVTPPVTVSDRIRFCFQGHCRKTMKNGAESSPLSACRAMRRKSAAALTPGSHNSLPHPLSLMPILPSVSSLPSVPLSPPYHRHRSCHRRRPAIVVARPSLSPGLRQKPKPVNRKHIPPGFDPTSVPRIAGNAR